MKKGSQLDWLPFFLTRSPRRRAGKHMCPLSVLAGAALAATGYDAQDAPVWDEDLRLAYLRRMNMSESEQLRIHLKNTFPALSAESVEDLAGKIETVRENYKFRYGKLMDYANFFSGVQLSVELENHSSFPRAVEIEDIATGQSLGRIFFNPWQRKTVPLVALCGGFGRLRYKTPKMEAFVETPFLQEGEVYRFTHARAPIAGPQA